MLIKYGNLDVEQVDCLIIRFQVLLRRGILLVMFRTIQLNLKFDNYDGIFDNLDTEVYWEIQETTNASDKRYFKIYNRFPKSILNR